MRADMFKIIVERSRWGAGHAPPVKLKKDKNDFKQIGLKRHAKEQAAPPAVPTTRAGDAAVPADEEPAEIRLSPR